MNKKRIIIIGLIICFIFSLQAVTAGDIDLNKTDKLTSQTTTNTDSSHDVVKKSNEAVEKQEKNIEASSTTKESSENFVKSNNLTFENEDNNIIKSSTTNENKENTVKTSNSKSNKDNNLLTATNDMDTYTLPNSEEVLRDGEGTFNDLKTAIDNAGNRLVLNNSYTWTSTTDRFITTGIVIDKNIEIIGNDIVIDARNSARVFDITASNVTISGITFINGYASTNGGSILTADSTRLTIINCTFRDSKVTGESGGALYAGDNSIIINSTFINSESSTNRGGAIWLGHNAYVYGCNFTNNSAKQYGGAIAAYDDLEVYNSIFKNNYAGTSGGAINIRSDGPLKLVENCIFINNSAKSGGAIKTTNLMNIFNSNFINNTASEDGGAIYGASKTGVILNITNSNFTGNDAIRNGGAVWAGISTMDNVKFDNNSANNGGAVYATTVSTLTDSSFTANSAKQYGGAVYATTVSTLTDSSFTANSAKQYGGAVYATTVSTLRGSNFTGNHANNGGAVYATTVSTLRGSNFTGNVANTNGGAIYVNYATINSTNFISNVANTYGGAISIGNKGSSTLTITIVNSNFTNNVANNEGGAIKGDNLVISYSNFERNNVVNYDGGAISTNTLTLNYSNFINNAAADDGGAIYTGAFEINYSNFINNTANDKAGAVYATAVGTLTNSSFTGNRANDGGAIFTSGTGGSTDVRTKIYDSNFTNNRALNGGAIYSGLTFTYITNCNLINNSANDGGAILVKNTNNYISTSSFINNTAKNYGGSVYVDDVIAVEITDSVFIGSYAGDGGAVCNVNTGTGLTLTNDTFIKNKAIYNGGAVYYLVNKGTSSEKIFRDYDDFDNQAEADGDRIKVKINSQYMITKCYFEENTDYLLNISVYAPSDSSIVTINFYSPQYGSESNIESSDISIVMNMTTDKSGSNNKTYIFDKNNWDTSFFNELQNLININIVDLSLDTNYTVTIKFSDKKHLNKEYTSKFYVSNSIYGDFQLIQNYINDATDSITLTRNYQYNTLDMDNHTGCINISKNSFTINGNGFAIDAQGFCRIFNITGVNVTLNNVVLLRGNAKGRDNDSVFNGGAIYWSGVNGTLNKVRFENNYAENGALYLNETALNNKIIICTFEENNATKKGGAIDCYAPEMHLINTTFISNYAGEYGAALCREETATGGHGENNIFIDNYAGIGGAALAWIKAQYISITNYTFTHNGAGLSGGAIYVGLGSESCKIINCTFEENYVKGDEEGHHGGAIEWYSTKGIVINSTFKFNKAYEGGAIFASNVSTDININDSKFIANEASAHGGAIALEASNVVLYNDYFVNNTAKEFGGAVHVHGNGIGNLISHSIFDGNVAGTVGGAIDWRANAGSIIYSNITNNKADYGGGISLSEDSMNSIIDHVIFIGNNATMNGGAIDCNSSNMYLTNTSFISNWAGEYGAALCREVGATGGHGESNNFTNNHAVISGAALAWMASDNIKIIDYMFINNTAGLSGGAIYVSNESDKCSVINSTFIGNYITADGDVNNEHYGHGGAIDWRGADGKVIKSNFKYNHAIKGGAIYVGSSFGITNITHSNFIENSATLNGGAVDLNASSVILDATYFRANVASKGGALYAGAGDSNKIHNSLFIDNTATEYGGAIDWLAKAGDITYSNFTNNSAENGGAIHFNGQSKNSFLEWVIFDGNTATNHGGAMDCDAENVTIYNITFKNNKADFGAALCRESNAKGGSGKDNTFIANHAYTSGAGLGWISSVGITITNYTFINNTAGFSGAAIYVDENSHNCTIIDSRFTGNHITNDNGEGGAIAILAKNTTIINSNFTKNNAQFGGAIFVGETSGNTKINTTIFTENSAARYGGAIDLKSPSSEIYNVQFYNNTAIKGGAIYVNGTNDDTGQNKVVLSLFVGNIASENGGAINWAGSQGHIEYSNFTNNQATYGGGLYLIGDTAGGSIVKNVIFKNNIASENGGAIDSNATKMELYNTTFDSNYAKYGAALCREIGAKGGSGRNNTFINNHAYISGAALGWMGVSDITIVDYIFINNTADKSGAVIYVGNGSDNCKVYNCTFENNFVTNALTGRGGAIDWIGNNGTVINTTFKNCVATTGGAIYVSRLSRNMTIINTVFELCKSTSNNGGALVIHGDDALISLSNFTACSSFEDGGAIAGINANNAKIIDSIFTYNSASGSRDIYGNYYGEGGAICWENSNNLQILNSKFYNNEAKLSGGSISAMNCNNSIVSNIFTNDSIAFRHGGSIAWIDSNNVTIEESFFNESGANYNGGSIYLTNVYDITIKNSNITSTWASWGYGGGIYVEGNVTISNVIFAGTYAHQYEDGTAIYFKYGNSTVLDSKFSDAANAIFIANKNTIVYLIGNNLTSLKPTKGVKYLTNDSVMGTYEIIDYAVWNEGILYLDGNKFDDVIFNNGTIETHTDTYVLDNTTWIQGYNDDFIFFVYTNDTDNNTIISIKSITHNGNQIDGTLYNLTYNAIKLKLTVPGTYIIYANDTGLKDNLVHTGIISVRIRTSLEIITSDPIDGNITITAIITPEHVTNITDESSPYNYPVFDGNITYILVNERNETIAISSNITSWNLTDLAAKNYGLYVTYNGNDFYFNCTNQTDFTISLWKVWLNVTVENIVYGNNATAIITSNSNGTVKFRLGNSEYDIVLGDDRRAELNITGLKPGNHTVGYVLLPNNYYGFAMNQTAFIVYKLATNMNVFVTTPIRVGDVEKINVTVTKSDDTDANITGNVELIINNKKYIEEVNKDTGKAEFTIYGLTEAKDYNVLAKYCGNTYYNETENNTQVFTARNKDDVPITITVLEPVYVGDTAQINVTLTDGISSGVSLYVDGKLATLVSTNNGNFTFNITGLSAGVHNIYAVYTGDENHLGNDTNKTFTVFKLGSQINVTVSDTFVGSNAHINVTVTPGATGNVMISVNGTNYIVTLDTNGKATLNITGLANATYPIVAKYMGDDKFNESINNTESFIVSKVNITGLTVNAPNTDYNKDEIIEVTVPYPDVTGTIYLELNDTSNRNITLNIIDGKVTWIVSGLAAGNYTVDVRYNGNDKYNISDLSETFKINKIKPAINLVFSGVVYSGAEIQIISDDIKDGNLNVTIDGHTYQTTIKDGSVTVTTDPLLEFKEYDINITYEGNENYTYFTNIFKGSTTKVTTYGLNIITNNITVKDDEIITVRVPDHVDDVVIWINGNRYRNRSFVNKEAIFNLTSLSGLHLNAGTYIVTATVNDTEFDHRNFTAMFTVSPLNTILDVDVHNVDIWDKEYINVTIRDYMGDIVTNATGNVTIKINGIEQSIPIVNGIARFNTTDLIAGENTVYVFYDGSRNYVGNSSLKTFIVNQRTPKIDVTATNATVNQATTITITIPTNATGYVIITGNFTNNEIHVPNSNFTNGVAHIDVTGLANGTYNVHVQYYGLATDNYTSIGNDTKFKVSKLNTTLVISAPDSVVYGTDVPVVVSVGDGVEGTITIKLNNILIGTYAILDGKVNTTLYGLGAKDYVIYAVYNGNDKYNVSNTESKTLRVERTAPVISIDPVVVDALNNAIIKVGINGTATGVLNITVNGKNYAVVNGEAVIDVLPVGEYNIVANYYAVDYDNYTGISVTLPLGLNVTKVTDYVMNVTATDVILGENSTITVNLPASGMNGTVAIYVNGTFAGNAVISGSVATLRVNKTVVGRYIVNATLKDDAVFDDRSVFANYYVSEIPRANTPLVIGDIDDKLVGDSAIITVTALEDVAGDVVLTIDGVPYNGSVSGGVVTFTVPDLTYGNKTVVVSYAGSVNYLSNSTTKVFAVFKRESGINVTAIGSSVGSDAHINVTVTPGATGNVVINVNGTNYTVTLDANAKAVLDIAGLGNGSYPVSVTYIGDNKFNSSTNYTDPFVMSKIPTTVDLNFSDINAGDDARFEVTMNPNIDGTVELTVNDKPYDVAIVNGVGIYIVNNFAKGTYDVKAMFAGDDKYEGSNSTVKQLIVHDVPTKLTIAIDKDSIFVGDKAVVDIILNQSINAVVTVKVNGNNNTVGLVNGKGSFTLINLNEGIYKITAVFAGDDKYVQSISNNITLNVSKQDVTIGIDVTGHVYGEVVPVGINVTAVGGNVTVTLDGIILGTYAILDGRVNLNLTSLSVGTHTLNVTYNGDNRYNTCKNSTIFAITNATLTANVTALNVTVEDNARFIIKVAEDFKGNVSIKVGDNELYNGTIKTIIETNKLLAGNYSATMVFYGDNNYNDLTIDNVNFTISRVTPTINVTIGDVTYPKDAIANINIGNYANGTVNVTVRNEGFIKVFSGQVIGGVANINLTHLPGGNYEAKVEFFSDDNYNNNVTLVNEFTILPNNSLITIVDLKDIYKVGEDLEFYIITENSTGDLTIQLNGVLYNNVHYDVTNKRYDICLENLNEGNYTIVAVLAGDRNYTGYTTSSSFKVIKNDLTINIADITGPIFVNSSVTFTANLNETVTGNIIFNINGMNYTVYVDNKTNATYQYTPNNNDTLTVLAKFEGNDKYNSNVSVQKQFIVYKQNVAVNISDIAPVIYGCDVFVDVSVPGATGSVVIRLNSTRIGEFAILNGKVNTTISGLAAGSYIIYANYMGDNKYNMSTANRTFNVGRATPVITIDKAVTDAITAGKVIVHINETATGTMNITVNGKTYEAPINDGVATFTIDVLPVGTYDITANYYALTDSNYAVGNKNLEYALNVTKVVDYVMNVTATDAIVGENSTITVNVPGITGNVVIWVNGVNKTVPIVDGRAILNVTQSVAGRYEVNATLVNENYTNKTVFVAYWVSESSTPITIKNITGSNLVDEDTIINVNVPVDISGIVSLSVDGETYYNDSSLTGIGIVGFKVPNISAGNKTFVVNYLGDNKYLPNSTVGNFTVFKRASGINVTAVGDISGNASVNVTVTPGAIGHVVVSVNGTDYTINLTADQDRINLTGLAPGDYDVTVTYLGDDNFNSSTNSDRFTIESKNNTKLEIDISGLEFVNDNGNITVTADEGITTGVTLTIDGNSYPGTYDPTIKKFVFNISDLSAGEHFVNVIYSGNDEYLPANNNMTIKVSKRDTPIQIEINPVITVDETQVINITLDKNATGKVIINIDGEEYNATLVNGKANYTTPKLPSGNHTLIITYAGNEMYNSNWTSTKFEVVKLASKLDLEVTNNPAGTNQTITVTLNNNTATGKVFININDKNYVVDLNEGTGKLIVNLIAGNYNIVATYNGDANFNSSSNSTTLNLPKLDSSVTVKVDNITYTDVALVNITVNENATGNVTVTIGDEFNKTIGITNDIITVIVPGLSYGDKTVNVTYNGDDNYKTNMTSTTFKVLAFTPDIKVIVQNITYGDTETVTVFINANGTVTIKGEGIDKTVNINNGEAICPITGLNANDYNIEVIYNGNGAGINSTSTSANFKVEKADPIMNITADSIAYGDTETVTVFVNASGSGKIRIYLNDNLINETDIVDSGEIIWSNTNSLIVGNYTIKAIYSDNENYLEKTITKEFKVIKAGNGINVINLGNGTVIIKTENTNSGNVTIQLGENNYTANITDGEAIINLNGAKPGIHNINITVIDNESQTTTTLNATVIIPKYKTPLNITLGDINVGDKQVITVNVPEGATGTITVKIDGKTYTELIKSNKAVFEIENLIAGNKTVMITYNGNDDYDTNTTSRIFNVSKYNSTIIVMIEDTNIGENVTVNVKLPKGANGIVLIDIDNVGYYANVTDGVASASIPRIPNGKYNVTVTYYGDDKYKSVTDSKLIIVNKSEASFNISDNGKGNILIKLPSDSTGTIRAVIDGKDYGEFALNNGLCELNIPGLSSGYHEYDISYSGDDNYEGFNKNGIVSIAKAKIDDNDINIPDLNNPSNDGTITITLPSDATGTIKLIVGGKEYSFPVNNGVCVIKIPENANGAYSIVYSGDNRYSSFTKTGTINNNKIAKTTLTLKTIKSVKKSAKKLVLSATLKIKGKVAKGKKLTFIFRGKKFTAKTNKKGVAKVTIKRAKLKKLLKKVKAGKKVVYKVKYGKLITKKYMRVGNKITLTLKSIKSVKKSAKKLKLRAKLKINGKVAKRKKVKFIFRGKKFIRKTNKKGIVKLTIKRSVLKKLLKNVKVGRKVVYKVKYGKKTVKKSAKVIR